MTRAALVTGAARGLGEGVAARLVDDGWAVALVDIDPETFSVAESAIPRDLRPMQLANVTCPTCCEVHAPGSAARAPG